VGGGRNFQSCVEVGAESFEPIRENFFWVQRRARIGVFIVMRM
jgi:hypothetical protein